MEVGVVVVGVVEVLKRILKNLRKIIECFDIPTDRGYFWRSLFEQDCKSLKKKCDWIIG